MGFSRLSGRDGGAEPLNFSIGGRRVHPAAAPGPQRHPGHSGPPRASGLARLAGRPEARLIASRDLSERGRGPRAMLVRARAGPSCRAKRGTPAWSS